MTDEPPLHEQLFHQCALTAFVQAWGESGTFPPDSRTVQRLAYDLYERELRRENAAKSAD